MPRIRRKRANTRDLLPKKCRSARGTYFVPAVIQLCHKRSVASSALQIALAAAALAAAGRVIQLAACHSDQDPRPAARAARSADRKTAAIDAELATLYLSCPMAATIDLATVANSPERAGALLPPYRPTAHRESAAQLEPEIPRIRYPVAVHSGSTSQHESSESIRVAAVPPKAQPDSAAKDWLVDPKEWYAPDEKPGAAPSNANRRRRRICRRSLRRRCDETICRSQSPIRSTIRKQTAIGVPGASHSRSGSGHSFDR